MTIQDIKKALMTCSVDSCKDCPYDNTGLYCCGKLKRDALDLITEQENEIDRLKAKDEETCLKCIESKHAAAEEYAKLQEEFANYQLASDKEIMAQRKQAKIDVLNKLRRQAWQGYQIGVYIVSTQEIDELIKETQNETV